ncbi:unnamed protein product, partial [Rotaria magnacalcarata]
MVDILKFQSITSTQSLIRNPNIFEIFNMNCSKSSFLMIRERSCFQLDNGTFIVKIGLINNLNCLLEFLKQQQQKQIKTNSRISEGEFRFDQLQKHFDSINVQYAFGSEDCTAYLSVEINAHNSLYLILLVKQKQLQPQALNIPIFNSPACESIFRNTRALSGIYSTIVNFTVHDFLRHAQRLPLSNDIECKQLHNGSVGKLVLQVHYKHRVERQSSFTHSQLEIDEIDIEQVITDAYHHAVDMLEGLDILNLLEEKHVLELKPLREYLFRQLNSNSNSQKHNYSFQISNIDDEVFESD